MMYTRGGTQRQGGEKRGEEVFFYLKCALEVSKGKKKKKGRQRPLCLPWKTPKATRKKGKKRKRLGLWRFPILHRRAAEPAFFVRESLRRTPKGEEKGGGNVWLLRPPARAPQRGEGKRKALFVLPRVLFQKKGGGGHRC